MLGNWEKLGASLVLALTAVCAAPVGAQSYPNKPIRMVVPFAPGGSNDVIARIVGQKLSEAEGVSVVIDNRPGAGGVVGTDSVAKAAPDGYTLMIGATSTMAVNPGLFAKMPFDTLKDLAPITQIAAGPFVLAVTASLPAKNVAELISLAKAKPGQLNFGSSGNGTSLHLTAELFNSMAKVSIVHVPYKGAGPALTDLISGQIHIIFSDMAALVPYIKAGQIRSLAVTSAKRFAVLQDLPTVQEAGVPGYVATSWYGVLGPSGIHRDIVMKLNGDLARIVYSPEMKEKFAGLGIEPVTGTPEEFGVYIRREIEKWSSVIKSSGAKVD